MVASWHPADAALAEGRSGTLSCNPAQAPQAVLREVFSAEYHPERELVNQACSGKPSASSAEYHPERELVNQAVFREVFSAEYHPERELVNLM